MAAGSQRRVWSLFVVVVGLVLMGLNALELSVVALMIGALLVIGGLVGFLVPG